MDEPTDRARHEQWVRAAVTDYERPLVLYAAPLLRGDLDAARDVVQDTFLKLCRQSQEDVGPHLPNWLFTVCRNRALDVLRKEKRMTLLSEPQADAALTTTQPPTSAPLEASESHAAVLRLLDTLPPNQQEAVRLKFQAGLSYREIATVMNITASYVGYLICIALKSVREQLAEIEKPRGDTVSDGTPH